MMRSVVPTFCKEMIDFAAERLMKLEVGAATGAEYGENSAERGKGLHVSNLTLPKSAGDHPAAQLHHVLGHDRGLMQIKGP